MAPPEGSTRLGMEAQKPYAAPNVLLPETVVRFSLEQVRALVGACVGSLECHLDRVPCVVTLHHTPPPPHIIRSTPACQPYALSDLLLKCSNPKPKLRNH